LLANTSAFNITALLYPVITETVDAEDADPYAGVECVLATLHVSANVPYPLSSYWKVSVNADAAGILEKTIINNNIYLNARLYISTPPAYACKIRLQSV
jgi:hypothetical protein